MQERHIRVQRSARYHLLGDAGTARAIWVVLHGYGQLARFFLTRFEGLAKDALIVAPEGLNRFYLDAQHQRVGATWMTREDRENEIRDQLDYLDAVADELRPLAGHPSLNVLGFSQGVATACRWAIGGRTPMARLVLWGGSLPPELDGEQMRAKHPGLRVELVHGKSDPLVPGSVVEANERLLRPAGPPYRVHRFEGGHELDTLLLARLFSS
jgi:predicted esterase